MSRCKVCAAAQAKYKCPTCRIPFCSVPCSKAHRENPCEPPDPATPVGRSTLPSEAPGSAEGPHGNENPASLTPAQVSSLRSNQPVRAALRDPALQAVLRRIDDAADPVAALHREFADPDFVAFVDVLLASVGAKESSPEERRQEDLLRVKDHLLQLVSSQTTGIAASSFALPRPTRSNANS